MQIRSDVQDLLKNIQILSQYLNNKKKLFYVLKKLMGRVLMTYLLNEA